MKKYRSYSERYEDEYISKLKKDTKESNKKSRLSGIKSLEEEQNRSKNNPTFYQDYAGVNKSTEYMKNATDNALHFSHYELHHKSSVKKYAKRENLTERQAAVSLAQKAATLSSNHNYSRKNHGVEGHKNLGQEVIQKLAL